MENRDAALVAGPQDFCFQLAADDTKLHWPIIAFFLIQVAIEEHLTQCFTVESALASMIQISYGLSMTKSFAFRQSNVPNSVDDR